MKHRNDIPIMHHSINTREYTQRPNLGDNLRNIWTREPSFDSNPKLNKCISSKPYEEPLIHSFQSNII